MTHTLPTSPKALLQAARTLIEDEERWCTRVNALDADGQVVPLASPQACRWCAHGALVRSSGNDWDPVFIQAWDMLEGKAQVLTGHNMVFANDNAGHATVLDIYDAAIEAAP